MASQLGFLFFNCSGFQTEMRGNPHCAPSYKARRHWSKLKDSKQADVSLRPRYKLTTCHCLRCLGPAPAHSEAPSEAQPGSGFWLVRSRPHKAEAGRFWHMSKALCAGVPRSPGQTSESRPCAALQRRTVVCDKNPSLAKRLVAPHGKTAIADGIGKKQPVETEAVTSMFTLACKLEHVFCFKSRIPNEYHP